MIVIALVSSIIVFVHYTAVAKSGYKAINIGDDPGKQCASNQTGILCGACMENFSLAIGSSQCIECSNSHNVTILLAFAAAGVFLVFFILILNLTATQGLINGLLFYANIVWVYKIILFPSKFKIIIGLYFFKCLSPGSTWTLELKPVSLLDWMLIGRYGYSFYSHSTSGPLLVLSLLLAATPLASLTSLVAELFLF